MISSDGERRNGTSCEWLHYKFRSRLEMRWAQYFERRFGEEGWLYEPYKFEVKHKEWTYRRQRHSYTTYYIPDFLIDGFGFVEVKPTVGVAEEESRKIILFAQAFPYPIWVICGPPGPGSKIIWAGCGKEPSLPLEFEPGDIKWDGRVSLYERL